MGSTLVVGSLFPPSDVLLPRPQDNLHSANANPFNLNHHTSLARRFKTYFITAHLSQRELVCPRTLSTDMGTCVADKSKIACLSTEAKGRGMGWEDIESSETT
jgi:hypothetical protein